MEIKPLPLCIPGIPYMVMVFPNDCSNFEIMKIAINVGNLSNTINVGDLSNTKGSQSHITHYMCNHNFKILKYLIILAQILSYKNQLH